MTSPTSRTLEYLRNEGWQCAVVEKWIAAIRKRQDVYGFGDILCCRVGDRPMLVQATSGSNMAARVEKIMDEPRRLTWLNGGGRILVIAWRKVGPRGKRKTWEARVQEIFT